MGWENGHKDDQSASSAEKQIRILFSAIFIIETNDV